MIDAVFLPSAVQVPWLLVLASITAPSLCCKLATNNMLYNSVCLTSLTICFHGSLLNVQYCRA